MNFNPAFASLLRIRIAVLLALAACSGISAFGQNATWTSTGDTTWSTPGNWNGTQTPGTTASNRATFNSANSTINPNLTTSATTGAITFATGNFTLSSADSATSLTLLGVGTTTSSAIVSSNTSGTNTISAPIILGGGPSTTATFYQTAGGTLAISGNISSTNAITGLSLTAPGATGTFTLSGNNTYNGTTTLASNTRLNINSATAISAGTLSVSSSTIDNTSAGAITLSNNNNITLGGTLTFTGTRDLSFGSGTVTVNAGSRQITTSAGTLTIGSINADTTARTFTKSGSGTLVIQNAAGSNFQGGFMLGDASAGGTLVVGHKNALGSALLTFKSNAASLFQASTDLSGANAIANNVLLSSSTQIISGSNNITFSGTWTNNGTTGRTLNSSLDAGKTLLIAGPVNLTDGSSTYGTFTINGTGDTTISGNITPGLGTGGTSTILQIGNTGTTRLSGSNTYSGRTNLYAGVTVLDSANALPSTSNLVLNGGVLGLGTGSSSFTRALGLSNGQVTWRELGGNSLQGGFAAYGADASVNLGGASTQVTWGTNSFLSNGTTAQAGWTFILGASSADKTVDFQNPISLGTSGTNTRTVQVDNGSAAIDAILSGVISGDANQTFSKTGLGTLALNATNTYTGATIINAGTLQIGTGGSTGNLSASSTITNNGTLTFNRSGNITQGTDFSNTISGTGNLIQAGSGNLTLSSNTNTYTGTTSVLSGTLTLSGTLSNSSVTVNGTSAVLNQTSAGSIGGTGATFTLTSGNATLAGNNTYTGTTSVLGGTLTLSGTLSNSSVTVNGTSAVLNQTSAGSIGGTGATFTLISGNATLAGTNIYAGATTINGGTLQIGAGSTTGSLATTSAITNNGTLVFNRSNNVVQGTDFTATAIGGSGSLVQNGTGTLTLNAANTYTGATTINAGTINLTGSNTASATTINSGGSLIGTGTAGAVTLNTGGTISAGNAAAASGNLTLGSLTLNGGTTYTWDFGNISGTAGTNWDLLNVTGNLTINATNVTGNKFTVAITGTPTGWAPATTQTWNIINYGSLTNAFDANVFDYTTSLTGAGTWSFTNNTTSKFIGLTYTVSSISTWSGGSGNWNSGFSTTPVNGTPLVFSGPGGTATNNIPSGNLTSLTTITINSGAGSYTLAANSGTSGFDAATPLTITGVTNNSANATTVNLALAVTSSSVLAIDAAAGNITMGGPISNNNAITFSGDNSTTVSGAISGTGAINKNGNGTLSLTATNTYAGATTINAGTLQITGSGSLGSSATYAGAISNNGTFTLNTTTDQTLSGIISGSGALVKSNTNNLTLSGANTFTGGLTLNTGTLILGNNSSLGTSGNITFSGGTMSFSSNGAGADYGARIKNSGSAIILDTNGQSVTFAGVIDNSNNSGLTKAGAGTLTLSGANTYTGGTTLNAGTLNINNSGSGGTSSAIGNGTLTIAGGTIDNTSAATVTLSTNNTQNWNGDFAFTGTRDLNLGTGAVTMNASRTVTVNGGNLTVGGIIGGNTFGLTKNGTGTLILSANNTYTGVTTINVGTLQIGAGSTTGSVAGNIVNNGTLVFNRSNAITYSGNISGSGNLTYGSGQTLTLSGSNSYTGGTTIRSGTTTLGADGGIGNGSLTFSPTANAFLNLNGKNQTVTSLNIVGSSFLGIIQNNLNNTTGTITFNISDGITSSSTSIFSIRDQGTNGKVAVVKSGNGTLDFSSLDGSRMNYTAGLTVNGGTFTYSSQNGTAALGNSTAGGIITLGGGTLNYNGTVGSSFTISNNVTLTASTASTLNNTNGTVNVTGTISGSGNLIKTGAGTLALSAANTYSGNTTVANGTLTLSGSGTLGTSTISITGGTLDLGGSSITNTFSSITAGTLVNGTITNNNANYAFQGGNVNANLAGTNTSLTKTGSDTLTLNGTNSYTGATTISAGNISISSASALGSTSGVNLANNTTLIYTGGSASTLDRAISVTSGTGTIRNNGGALTLTGGLTKNGTTLTLDSGTFHVNTVGISGSAANSDLVIDGATVNLNVANTYNGPTRIIDGGTLNANIADALPTANGRTAISIDATGTGSSTLALGASQSIASLAGNTTSTVALGSSTLTIGTTSGSTTYAGSITGTGNLVKDGASTQVLTGNNTGFAGNTTISGGTLQAAAAGAMGNSTVINVNGGSFLVTAENAVNDNANINLGGGRMAVSGTFNENVGLLTLSANSTLDFAGFVGTLRFSGVSSWAPSANLAIWNWSGTTYWGTQVNNYQNPSRLVFDTSNAALTNNLANISFYSDNGNSFVGNGLVDSSFTGGGNLIIAVPEPETYLTGVLLILGATIYQLRIARHGRGLLRRLAFLRRRANRKPLEGQPPA